MEAMNKKVQKTKEITIPKKVADKQLLKESMRKKQAEIEAAMIEEMEGKQMEEKEKRRDFTIYYQNEKYTKKTTTIWNYATRFLLPRSFKT